MSLKDRIEEELKNALRQKEKVKLSTLRLLKASLHNAEIEKKEELNDDEVIEIVAREVKKRKEAIEEYNKGNRPDLAQKESEEKGILEEYLPEQLSEEEIKKIIDEVINEVEASEPNDVGKVMGQVMPKVKGRADGKVVNQLVREALSK